MQQRPIGNRTVSADRPRRDAALHRGPARPPPGASPPSTPRSMPASPSSTPPTPTPSASTSTATARSWWPRRSPPTAARPTTCSSRPRAGTAAPATAAGPCTATPPTSRRRARRRSSASASMPSGSTSTTAPTPRCRGPSPSARWPTCSTRARSSWPASPTPPWPRSTRRSRCSSGRLVSVQNQFSPRFRSSEGELEHCEKLGIAFIPWSPLGGIGRADDIERDHPAFAAVAAEVGASPQQVTLAWMLAKGSRVIPIPGSSRPETAARLGRGGRPRPERRAGGPPRRRPDRRQATAPVEQNVVPACCTTVRRTASAVPAAPREVRSPCPQ